MTSYILQVPFSSNILQNYSNNITPECHWYDLYDMLFSMFLLSALIFYSFGCVFITIISFITCSKSYIHNSGELNYLTTTKHCFLVITHTLSLLALPNSSQSLMPTNRSIILIKILITYVYMIYICNTLHNIIYHTHAGYMWYIINMYAHIWYIILWYMTLLI